MLSMLKAIWQDVQQGENIELYLTVLAAIILVPLNLFGVAQSWVAPITLATLGLLAVSMLVNRRRFDDVIAELKQSKSSEIEGIAVFRTKRHKLPPLREVLEAAQKDIAMLAIQHDVIVHQYLSLLERKAKMGCKVRILMMSPWDENGNINPNVKEYESRWKYYGLQAKLETNRDIFRGWLGALPNGAKQRIEVRSYFDNPIASYLLIDQGESGGYIQVEIPVFYELDVEDLPHYIVRKRDDEDFFLQHVNSFEHLWNKSHILSVE